MGPRGRRSAAMQVCWVLLILWAHTEALYVSRRAPRSPDNEQAAGMGTQILGQEHLIQPVTQVAGNGDLLTSQIPNGSDQENAMGFRRQAVPSTFNLPYGGQQLLHTATDSDALRGKRCGMFRQMGIQYPGCPLIAPIHIENLITTDPRNQGGNPFAQNQLTGNNPFGVQTNQLPQSFQTNDPNKCNCCAQPTCICPQQTPVDCPKPYIYPQQQPQPQPQLPPPPPPQEPLFIYPTAPQLLLPQAPILPSPPPQLVLPQPPIQPSPPPQLVLPPAPQPQQPQQSCQCCCTQTCVTCNCCNPPPQTPDNQLFVYPSPSPPALDPFAPPKDQENIQLGINIGQKPPTSPNWPPQNWLTPQDPNQPIWPQSPVTIPQGFQPSPPLQVLPQPQAPVPQTFQPNPNLQLFPQPQAPVPQIFQPDPNLQLFPQPQSPVPQTFQPSPPFQVLPQPQSPVPQGFQPGQTLQVIPQPQSPVPQIFQPSQTLQIVPQPQAPQQTPPATNLVGITTPLPSPPNGQQQQWQLSQLGTPLAPVQNLQTSVDQQNQQSLQNYLQLLQQQSVQQQKPQQVQLPQQQQQLQPPSQLDLQKIFNQQQGLQNVQQLNPMIPPPVSTPYGFGLDKNAQGGQIFQSGNSGKLGQKWQKLIVGQPIVVPVGQTFETAGQAPQNWQSQSWQSALTQYMRTRPSLGEVNDGPIIRQYRQEHASGPQPQLYPAAAISNHSEDLAGRRSMEGNHEEVTDIVPPLQFAYTVGGEDFDNPKSPQRRSAVDFTAKPEENSTTAAPTK